MRLIGAASIAASLHPPGVEGVDPPGHPPGVERVEDINVQRLKVFPHPP